MTTSMNTPGAGSTAEPTAARSDSPPDRPEPAPDAPANMVRAGLAEAVGTFFLVYTGTATAAAGALGKSTAGTPPDSLAVALRSG